MDKNEIFKKLIKMKFGKKYELLSDYKDENEKILIKHSCGKKFLMLPFVFLLEGKCPKCFGKIKNSDELFKNKIKQIYKNQYIILGKYKNNNKKIEVFHKKCKEKFFIKPQDLLRERKQCPYCYKNLSRGEIEIKNFLEENNIEYKVFFKFKNLKFKKNLEFDFAVFNKNGKIKTLIEYDGEQHYKKI